MPPKLRRVTLDDGTPFWCLRPGEVRFIQESVADYFRHGIAVEDGDVVFDVGANIGLFAHDQAGYDLIARQITPEAVARHFARSMKLRLVPLTDPWARRQMWVCVKEYQALPASARQLVEHLSRVPAGSPPT